MPRDVNGTYTLPAGNPVVTLTPIATTWANPTLSDLASAMTDSLDRYGRGGMLAPFQFANGAVGAPSMTFTSEPTTGFYRIGAGQIGVAIAGVLKLTMQAAGFNFVNAITVNGTSFDPADYLSKAGNLSGLTNTATARTNIGLGNVENVALSGWIGSTSITTLGTITTGTVPVARVSGLGTIATQNSNSVSITGGSIGPFTITGAITGGDYDLTRANLKDYSEQKQVVAAAATTNIDFTSGSVVELTQDTNITTLNLNNPPPTGTAGALTIIRVKDATGTTRTITWPASVKWMNAAAPTLTQTTGAVDIINLITYDAGTTWRGTYATNFA